MTAETGGAPRIDRAFGAESRLQLLDEYFSIGGDVTSANAWKHVSRLLLWTDRTTGLAHCYESDKAQPGRKWYERSLAFHDWLAGSLGIAPHDVAAQVDWLFRRGTERLAAILASQEKVRSARAAEQRAPYAGRGFPEPGEDPVLESLIREVLSEWLADPPPEVMRQLTDRIRTYFGQENKRKNLVGEGFEDVLAALIRRATAFGLDPLSWTSSERWIRCPACPRARLAGVRAGSSLKSSKKAPCAWSWTRARPSARSPASWT